MSNEIWSLLKLLQWTSDYFRKHNIENPRLNVEYLLGKITGLDRVDLYVNYDRIMSKSELDDFKKLIKRRLDGEPLQYITGETSFYGYPIKVNPAVLIPRPETELLVEKVKDDLKDEKPGILVDIGTGSGCIAISMARLLPEWNIIATDISESALVLARQNAELNSVESNIRFIKMDVKEEILPDDLTVDVIVSNPPYVSIEEYPKLPVEVRGFEPEIALHDEGDGLSFYRAILEAAPGKFSNGNGRVYFELGYQSLNGDVQKIAEDNGYSNEEIIPDYAGINRILKVVYNEKRTNKNQ